MRVITGRNAKVSCCAVNNSAVGKAVSRDTCRTELSALPANFPLIPRQPLELAPCILRCEKDPLNLRYENILAAADLIPETLSAMMHRASLVMASNGRILGSAALVFARHLLHKYVHVVSVAEWGKNFKATFDKRLVSELESGRSDGEFGFPLGVPAGVHHFDEFLRQKISGVRISRVGLGMRDVVQRLVDEAFPFFCAHEKKSPHVAH